MPARVALREAGGVGLAGLGPLEDGVSVGDQPFAVATSGESVEVADHHDEVRSVGVQVVGLAVRHARGGVAVDFGDVVADEVHGFRGRARRGDGDGCEFLAAVKMRYR